MKSKGRPKRGERIRGSIRSKISCSVICKKMGRSTLGRERSAAKSTKTSGATFESKPNSTGKKKSNDHHHTRRELRRRRSDTKSEQKMSNDHNDTKHQAAGEQEKYDDCFSKQTMPPQRHHDRRLSAAHLNNDDDKSSGAEIGNKKENTSFLLSGISSMNHVLSRAQIELDDDLSESELYENSIPVREFYC